MNEYTLIKDITSYTYPSHMKRPDGFFGSNFFEKWIPKWNTVLGHLSGKPNIVGIEIGCLHGDCTVFCADKIVNGEGSIHYAIDINTNEYLENNLAPYIDNVQFIQGKSYDILRHNFKENTADYIYIDGSHLAIDVLSDAVLAWHILKDDGIIIFDDYGWGIHTTDDKQKPKLGIDAFLLAYKGHYELIDQIGWQVYLKKLHYTYLPEELEANYQK
jgi:cephalosporin hydroxylase